MKLDEIITQEDFLGDFKDFADRIAPKMKSFADKVEPQMKKGAEDMKQYFDQEFHNKKEPKKSNKDNMLTTDVNEQRGKRMPSDYFNNTNDADIKSTPTMGGYRQTKNTKNNTYTDHYDTGNLSTRSTYDDSGNTLHSHNKLSLGDKAQHKSKFYPNNMREENVDEDISDWWHKLTAYFNNNEDENTDNHQSSEQAYNKAKQEDPDDPSVKAWGEFRNKAGNKK